MLVVACFCGHTAEVEWFDGRWYCEECGRGEETPIPTPDWALAVVREAIERDERRGEGIG